MKLKTIAHLLIAVLMFAGVSVNGQETAPPQADDSAAPPAADQPAFKPEELDQMLASVALYPDSLLSQIFMASTYPIEVVEADRWVKAHKDLKGDALAKELEKQTWDASVRSLVNFPQVLAMMSENLSNTVKIGDAFIGQQKEVMDSVQRLRAKAKETGNLKSTDEQKVETQTTDSGSQVIVIESSSPDVVYVPSYDPVVVYGGWPYPAYPPYPYYPPGYVAHPGLAFGLGVACGAAWGYAWGNCDWGHGDVDIDIDQNFERNTNIDRDSFKNKQTNREGNRGDRQGGQGGKGKWQHDPSHRQGATYRNKASADKVGAGRASNRTTQARSEYRGKADAGRQDIARGGADSAKNRSTGSNRSGGASAKTSDRSGSSSKKGGALNDSSKGGKSTREASNRGSSSRKSSPSTSRSSGSRSSGASRGGGGGRSGGGGGRGGGRGGGGRR